MLIDRLKLLIKDLVYSFRMYRMQDLDRITSYIYSRIYERGGFHHCPLCGHKMTFRYSRLSFPPYRDDVAFKCKNCLHTNHRGFPITKRQYEIEVNLRQGRTFMLPSFETGREQIKDRLKALGYLEF